MPVISILGVSLLLSSCAGDVSPEDNDAVDPEQTPAAGPSAEPEKAGTAEAGSLETVVVDHLECKADEALETKGEHNADRDQPIGWPMEGRQAGKLPDPLCHPDYLEIGEWIHIEEFRACCEGIETSNIVDDGTRSQESINEGLWEQSMARFQWSAEQQRE